MTQNATHEPCPGSTLEAEDNKTPRPCSWGDLPESLRCALSTVPKDQWTEVIVTVCPSELVKDATEMVSTFAQIWQKSRHAEDFRNNPLTGEERGQFKKDLQKILRNLAELTIKLGVRARVFGELQRAKALLLFYAQDIWQGTWRKSMAPKVTKPPIAPPRHEGPKKAAAPPAVAI